MPIELGPISLDTDVVIQQLRRDLTDDWFPDPLRYEDLLKQDHLEDIHGAAKELFISGA